MKKTIQQSVSFCDSCGRQESHLYTCLICATEMCFDCFKKHGVTYEHSVNCSGSGDGHYCKSCDEKLKRDGSNRLHNAYLDIRSLRLEGEQFWADYQKRSKLAESRVLKLAKS